MIDAAMGVRGTAVDIDPTRLDQALACGAPETADATDGDAAERINEVTAGGGAAFTVECSGNADAISEPYTPTRRN
jgi:alcohol dehydrogenase